MSAPVLPEAQAAQRLQLWFSPAMPTGAFSHGHGIEAAIDEGDIRDADSLRRWLDGVLARGAGRNEAVLICAAWRATHGAPSDADDGAPFEALVEIDALVQIDALARALCAGAERLRETLSQGRAFADAVAAWPSVPGCPPLRDFSLPVVIGAASAAHALPLAATLVAALQAFITNLAWIAARLLPLGQGSTLGVVAALEPVVRRVARRALDTDPSDPFALGGSVMLADLASLRHETQRSRICLT